MRRAAITAWMATLLSVGATVLAPASEASWLPPVDISASAEHSESPQVVLDSAGNATAVWSSWNGTDTVVESAYRPAGAGWQAPIVISAPGEDAATPGASDADSPRIVVDRNDNVTVTWQRYAGTRYLLQSVDRPAGGSWTEPQTFAETPLGANLEPWIAGDWEGNQMTVWDQEQTIRAAFRPFAGDWGEPQLLSDGENFAPQAAMDARGDATAVWMHHDESGRYVVEGAYRPEQGEWEDSVLVSQPGEEGGNPHVALDAKGDSLVVWRGEDGGEEVLRAAYRPVGGEWGQPTDVSAPGELAQSPHAAVDPAGNAIVAWAGNTPGLGGNDIVHVAFKPAAGSWEAPQALSSPGGNSYPSDVVFDNGGNAALTWQRWDGAEEIIQAAYRPAGGSWEAPITLSEAGKESTNPVVVLDAPGLDGSADGYATAVWISGENVCAVPDEKGFCINDTIQAAGYDPEGLPEVEVDAPPTAIVGEPVEVSTPTAGLFSPQIDFGDGTTVDATDATHTYDTPGTYDLSAGGAELLGYRTDARSQIVVEPGDGSETGGSETGGGSETEESGGGSQSGETPADPPAGGQGTPQPQTLPPAPAAIGTGPSPACLAAQAAGESASRNLRRLRSQAAGPSGGRRAKHLAGAKHRQQAALRRARAALAGSC